jgi:acyl carrier protein
MSDSVAERVIAVVNRSNKLPDAQISMDSSFQEIGMSSLDALALIFDLEEEFGVSIPDNEAMQISNVRQAVEALERLLGES